MMTPSEYMKFHEGDFEVACLENGFNRSQAREFFDIICDYLGRFKQLRHNLGTTRSVANELIKHSKRLNGIGNDKNNDQYKLILLWVYKALHGDPSYNKALFVINKYYKNKGVDFFDKDVDLLTDTDIESLLDKEILPDGFIIEDNKQMKAIFEACDGVFKCNYHQFREGVKKADFSNLNIKRQNVAQELIYRLSGIMGKGWYDNICSNMSWEKTVISGQGKKLEFDPTIKRLNKILPRQSRRSS